MNVTWARNIENKKKAENNNNNNKSKPHKTIKMNQKGLQKTHSRKLDV